MNRKDFLFNLFEIVLLLIFIVIPIRMFLFEPFLVRGLSMEPNFHNLDYLIIDKLTYKFKEPQRGDVIVFKPPLNEKVFYIKRIIGLPNEKIIIQGSTITIFNKDNPNGFNLKENYLPQYFSKDYLEIQLGEDEYFVLGDNREISYDSRKWGPLKKQNIIGKVILRFSFVDFVHALTK